ncbi:hypothetical protein [Propionivibrio sp.]
MKGCELFGRYAFFNGSKNARLEQKKARAAAVVTQDGDLDKSAE